MRLVLPLPLRRFLLGHLLFSVTLATSASAAEFIVDASQVTDSSRNVYGTLQELAASGVLASGDTVVLYNDDSSLTGSLTAAVNFRSNDPNTFRTIDLASGKSLYDETQLQGNVALEMDAVIWSNFVEPITGIYSQASSLEITGRVQFTGGDYGNVFVVQRGSLTLGNGVVFYKNTNIQEERPERLPALIYNAGQRLTIGNDATFSSNMLSVSQRTDLIGGMIYNASAHLTIGDNATFSDNSRFSSSLDDGFVYGGAIYNLGSMTIGSNAVFVRNKAFGVAGANGGAIVHASPDNLTFRDGVLFVENYATKSGGAIWASFESKLNFYALTKDVLFSGNMTGGAFTLHDDGSFSVENGIANAIFFLSGAPQLTLVAAQGREVRFNDPIINPDSYGQTIFTFNRYTDGEGTVHDTDGTIVFSGELYQGEEAHLIASRYNEFRAQTTLYGGTLVLEHDVVFGRSLGRYKDDKSSLTVEKGVLEITGGSTANADIFTLSGPDAVLRPGDNAFINAYTADFSRGFTFDMRHQLQADPVRGPGLELSALESFTAGGFIGVADAGDNAPYFYADRSWRQDRVFHVLTDAEHTLEGDFEGAVSQATGTDRVDSPYSYTGTWSHQWVDADGDGYAEQLQLVWKADGGPISQIAPELAGELAYNSLWSSASNAAALGGNVLSRLNAFRLADKHSRDLWGMGLGDFARQRSRGGVDGYDYNGGGYSVGADSGFGEDIGIFGIAFGQLYGHAKSRDFQGRNTQDTRMGSLYWGQQLEESKQARWTFKGSLTWAETHNKMDSRLSGAPSSTGKWNNQTWLAQLEVSRTADYAGGWRLTPFVRVEFTHGSQDAFREQGGYGRDFGGATLRRLSIPVGLEIGRTDEWKGRPWTQSLRLSYVGDALQDVPGGTVYSPYSDMSWRGRAVSPGRHGLRAEYNTFLQCNEHWSVYGGYGLEVRGSSAYHRVNAGVSRSF